MRHANDEAERVIQSAVKMLGHSTYDAEAIVRFVYNLGYVDGSLQMSAAHIDALQRVLVQEAA